MKKQYDFSKAVRGKFYRRGLKLNLPVYLDEEALAFVQGIAVKKRSDISAVAASLRVWAGVSVASCTMLLLAVFCVLLTLPVTLAT